MLKKRTLFIAVFAMILSLIILPHGTVFAQLADGTYNVPYEMKEAKSNNTSIADGYFQSPAKVTIQNGKATVQITVTGADMIKSLSAPSGPVTVVSESGDKRTVKFTVDDLSQPVNMGMHIVVPDLYDMEHTARAVFDTSSIPAAGSGSEDTASENTTDENVSPEDNPPTGDNSQIMLYALLLVGSAGALFVVRKLRPANN